MVRWGSVRVLTSLSRQITEYYASRKRRASAPEEYDHEKGEKRRHHEKNNYRFSVGVSRANKPTDLLPHKNKIIFRPPPDSHRNSHARRSRDAGAA
jgi:hypothetical protein